MSNTGSVPLEEMLVEIKYALRLQDSPDHNAELNILIDRCILHIDSLDVFEDTSCVFTLSATENRIKLPRGFKKWQGLRFLGLTGSDETGVLPINSGIGSFFNEVIYYDFKFLNDCRISTTTTSTARPYTDVCKVTGGYIVFNSDIAGRYTQAQLAYTGLAKDDNGRLLIQEEFKRAIENFVCWQMAKRYPERYDAVFKNDCFREWTAQKGWLNGEAQVENAYRNRYAIENIIRKLYVNTV